VLADLFPPQAGLWSSPHPSRATPSRCLGRRHRRPARTATTARTPQQPPTLGSGDGRHYWHRAVCGSGRSTGTPSPGQRRWHPWPGGRRPGADGTRGGAACGVGAAARYAPITRQGYANRDGLCLARCARYALLWHSKIADRIPLKLPIGIGS
jgi:hypothetical protein